MPVLYSATDLVAAEAPCAGVYVTWGSVYHGLNALDVRLPCAVTAPMRMAHLYSESNFLIAKLTLSHLLHLLACVHFSKQRTSS
jgi:hypothetical protein